MKRNALTLILLFAGCLACASTGPLEMTIQKLEKENAALKAREKETQAKIDDLSTTLMILQDRIAHMKPASETVASTSSQTPVVATAAPVAREPAVSPLGFETTDGSLPSLRITNNDLRQNEAPLSEPKLAPSKDTARAIGAKVSENPEATKAYNDAYQSFEKQKYTEAIAGFQIFLSAYPGHAYADNAIYWIGESHYRQGDFGKAVTQLERVSREYPTGSKVPDALVRAGSCYLKLARPLDAKRMFEKVVAMYPQSFAAKKARASLAELSVQESSQRRM